MINYGSDEDVAQLIAHKIGMYPDITPHNIKGMVMRVLGMMGHRPQDLDYVVKRTSEILAQAGKMNESAINELSFAQMDDETIHGEENEDAAQYLRAQMQKYQPINMARATKLVHRKYDGEKSLPDIHDILLRFVKYLKLDGKFVSSPVSEAPDVHALAAADEQATSMTAGEHQRKHAEELAKAKQIHQFARRNIRGDKMGVDEASEYQKIEAKRKRQSVVMGPAVDVEAEHDALYLVNRMKNYGAIDLDRATTLVKTNFSDKTEDEQKTIVHVLVDKLKAIGKFVDYKNMNESNKHRQFMDDHFKRARQHLYGFPTATQGEEDKEEGNTTTVMSSGDADIPEAEEIESTSGADGTISQDGDELTETSGDEQTANIVIKLDGMPTNVDVAFVHNPDADSPITVLSIVRSDNGDPVDESSLSPVEQYNIHSECFQATQESEVEECDAPMIESELKGQFNLETMVSTPDEDDIPVVANYDIEEDDDGSYAVVRSLKRTDTGEDVKAQVNPADLETVDEECYQDYLEWARQENDDMAISRHLSNMGEDMRPSDAQAPISDERAARKIVHKIMGLPNLTYAVVEKWVSKFIKEVGKTADDIETIARLAFNELAKVGLAIKESAEFDEADLSEGDKTRNATLELPIADSEYEVDDVDVTVSYKFAKGEGEQRMSVEIFKVVRDDTGEDITTEIDSKQLDILMQGCADDGMVEESDDDLSDDAYLDKRVVDYFDAANRGLTKGTYKTWGKTFNTYMFASDAEANAFMEENSGWGVIGVDDDGTVHVAKMGDVGVEESQSVQEGDFGAKTIYYCDGEVEPDDIEDESDPLKVQVGYTFTKGEASSFDTYYGGDPGSADEIDIVSVMPHGSKENIKAVLSANQLAELEHLCAIDAKDVMQHGFDESEEIIKVPRDQQKSLENEIEVGGINGPKQHLNYIKRMKALAGLK